ncbi:MAG: helix-turn-helix domain-containing protein [Methanoregula sp.]|jgi:predicted transcriptional regulator|nr:helix-turn-helix domain-containing protein [Methanoregula sp.]
MDTSKRSTDVRVPVFILTVACLILFIVPVSAYTFHYSVLSWSDNPPDGEAKVPVPVEIWQVPPVTVLLVCTAVFLPICLVPVEILVSCMGFVVLNFRRIRKKEIFGNDCRALIYHHIVANSGSGFAAIMQSLPVNRGTLHYHLGILCRERLIVAFSINNSICYFQNAGKFSDTEMDAIARLRNRVNLSICTFLSLLPDASRQDIAERLKITGSTVSWHMRRLCEARLITSAREGRNVRYRLTPVAAKVIDELR